MNLRLRIETSINIGEDVSQLFGVDLGEDGDGASLILTIDLVFNKALYTVDNFVN